MSNKKGLVTTSPFLYSVTFVSYSLASRCLSKRYYTELTEESLFWCRREDSNLHPVDPDQTLNLARLPIPPLRHGNVSCVQI